jgi:hypothetical protein
MHNAGIAVLLRATMGLVPHEGGGRMSRVDAPSDEQRQRDRTRKPARSDKS